MDSVKYMSFSAWIEITKYYKLGGLNNENAYPHSSRGSKSSLFLSDESSLLGL